MSISARVAAVVVAAALATVAFTGTSAGQSTETVVPGTAHVHNGPLLPGVFEKGKSYTLEISGTVDISPSASRQIDAVYCIFSAVGTSCNPPYAVCGVQLTWYRGSTYSHYTLFGCPAGGPPLGLQESHVYTETIVPPFDAMIRAGVSGYDTGPEDNTGSFTVKVTGPPAAPTLPKPTPASAQPALGATTSYTAPKPLVPLALRLPGECVRQSAGQRADDSAPTACRVEVSLTRAKGPRIDDPGFITAVEPSDRNTLRAAKVCFLLLLDKGAKLDPGGAPASFARCVDVVSRILQRDEELRRRREAPSELLARAGGCRSVAVPPRRASGLPLRVTCARTRTGLRVTIRSAIAGRSLPSALGRSPRLIVGRSRRAAGRPGDRVNVLWTTVAPPTARP